MLTDDNLRFLDEFLERCEYKIETSLNGRFYLWTLYFKAPITSIQNFTEYAVSSMTYWKAIAQGENVASRSQCYFDAIERIPEEDVKDSLRWNLARITPADGMNEEDRAEWIAKNLRR